MATINNGESGSSVRTKLNDIINKVEGVTSINNDIDVTGTVTADGLTVENTATGTTASPQYTNVKFVGYSSQDRALIRAVDTASSVNGGQLEFLTTDATNSGHTRRMNINRDGDISFYEDTGTTPKFFWDASAESLGIGTSSPSSILHLSSAQSTVRTIAESTNAAGYVGYRATNGTGYWEMQVDGANQGLRWLDDGTEAMRLDASGSLLVGKTSADSGATAGIETSNNGRFNATRDGSISGVFNRLTSDGNIVEFRKDGTTVGSIGTDTTYGEFFISGAGNRGGIGFYDIGFSGIQPVNSDGSVSDGDTNLGYTSSRFKDLYLSGGVYLGGTGAANLLDDYETGTWTITDGSGAGLSFTVQDNVYTKVGRLVVASANITWPSTANTSNARIVLPFTSIANNSHSGGVVTEQNWNTLITLTASCNYTDGVIFRQRGALLLTNAELSGKKLRFTVTYHAA